MISTIITFVVMSIVVASPALAEKKRDEVLVNYINEISPGRCEVSFQDLADVNQVFVTRCDIIR